jgi:hypothetical protein
MFTVVSPLSSVCGIWNDWISLLFSSYSLTKEGSGSSKSSNLMLPTSTGEAKSKKMEPPNWLSSGSELSPFSEMMSTLSKPLLLFARSLLSMTMLVSKTIAGPVPVGSGVTETVMSEFSRLVTMSPLNKLLKSTATLPSWQNGVVVVVVVVAQILKSTMPPELAISTSSVFTCCRSMFTVASPLSSVRGIWNDWISLLFSSNNLTKEGFSSSMSNNLMLSTSTGVANSKKMEPPYWLSSGSELTPSSEMMSTLSKPLLLFARSASPPVTMLVSKTIAGPVPVGSGITETVTKEFRRLVTESPFVKLLKFTGKMPFGQN